MDADLHEMNRVAMQVTRAALIVRLFAILAALVGTFGRTVDMAAVIGCVIAGLTGFLGLTRPELLSQVTRHPSLALLDLLLVASATAVGGPISPFVLAVLTTALLLGLWVETIPGVIVIVALLGVYILGSTKREIPSDDVFLSIVVVPFIYVMLWYLGLTIQRALRRQDEAQRVLRDAISTAAAAEERSIMARELHDSVAKTVQGIALASGSLPVHLRRDPVRAESLAGDIQGMAVQAVHELRTIMGQLRTKTSTQTLGRSAALLVAEWQAATGRMASVEVDPDLDTSDEAIRYELLAVLQEALDNVNRHAGPADVTVRLVVDDSRMRLLVSDNGRGSHPLAAEGAARAGHYGVQGFHERMARVGGLARWTSAPGEGTTVVCDVHREGLLER